MTAAEVWQNWKDFATSTGQTVTTTSEEMDGSTLVVTEASFVSSDGEAEVVVSIDELRFAELGDGSVEVTMSPSYPITIDGTAEGGAENAVELMVSQTNLRTIASGTLDNISYTITSDSIAVTTVSVTEEGEAIPVNVSVVMNGAGGTYVMSPRSADIADLTSTFNATSLDIKVQADDQEIGSKVDLSASVGAFATVMNGTFGATLFEFDNPAEAVAAGLAMDFGVTYGAVAYAVDLVESGSPTAIKGKSDGGALGFVLDKAKMAFKGGGKGVQIVASGAEIPFPEVMIAYAESAFDVSLPVTKGPETQNFTMVAKLIGATVSEDIWALVDPAATIPRDPATVIVDTRGTARLDIDLMDETAMNSGAPPGELRSLDIPALQLTIGGAEFTGNGALTFDNTDLTTFQGMPAPTGKIDLRLAGGNGLLDKLIALGIVPEEQAMGARMMMGMFARPGDGPDTLTSTLEFKDKGFFANGMQLQ
ncbi:MAG: DUF2125 domain-containing protein [Gemmobacter sp.]